MTLTRWAICLALCALVANSGIAAPVAAAGVESPPSASEPPPGDLNAAVSIASKFVVSVNAKAPDGRRWVASGVIWDQGGNVVTIAAIAHRSGEFEVITRAGEVRSGELVGADDFSGIAVILARGLAGAAIELAELSGLRLGEPVAAVGNPFNLPAAHGVVSQFRRLSVPRGALWMIQTTAAINPGDVGGLLIDRQGRMIGLLAGRLKSSGVVLPSPFEHITTLVAAPSLPSQPTNFALPADVVSCTAGEIIAHGRVRRPWFGFSAMPASRITASSQLLPRQGALVAGLVKGSPAETAGLQIGDVIVQLAARPVGSPSDLQRNLMAVAPGQAVEVLIVRGGDTIQLCLLSQEEPQGVEETWHCGGGLVIHETGLAVAEKCPWPGLQPGDKIIAVEGYLVKDLPSLQTALLSSPGHLTVLRGQTILTLPLSASE